MKCQSSRKCVTGKFALALAAIQLAAMPIRGQPVDDVDHAAAESHHVSGWSLHNGGPAFPDGAKGGTLRAGYEEGMLAGSTTTPAARVTYRIANIYCFRDAILLAKYVDSEPPMLSKSEANIYTVSHFQVSQVIKGDGLVGTSQTIVTYRDGGELKHKGEVLRIDTPDAPPYEQGKTYLLYLDRDKRASKQQYQIWDQGTTVVTNSRVYPSIPLQAGFLPGTTTADVIAKFGAVTCPP